MTNGNVDDLALLNEWRIARAHQQQQFEVVVQKIFEKAPLVDVLIATMLSQAADEIADPLTLTVKARASELMDEYKK